MYWPDGSGRIYVPRGPFAEAALVRVRGLRALRVHPLTANTLNYGFVALLGIFCLTDGEGLWLFSGAGDAVGEAVATTVILIYEGS